MLTFFIFIHSFFLSLSSPPSPSPFALSILPQGSSESTTISLNNMSYYIYTNIDLTLNFTWLSPYLLRYQKSSNKISSNITITLFNKVYSAELYQDQITMLNYINKTKINLPNFLYYYLTSEIRTEHDSIGLAHSFTNNQYSIVHQLYNNNYIDKRSFTFILNEYITPKLENSNFIFFGTPSLPYVTSLHNTKHLTCKVKQHLISWGCELNKIEFNSKHIQTYALANQIGYFQTYKYNIQAPIKFIEYLYMNMFYDYFKNGTCKYTDGNYKKIICLNEYVGYFDSIRFCFGNEGKCLLLRNDKLFVVYSTNYMLFVIEENHINKDNDKLWLFGKYFMPFFNSTFSYDDDSVTFYSDNYVVEELSKKMNMIKGLFCINGVILIGGMVLMLFCGKFIKR